MSQCLHWHPVPVLLIWDHLLEGKEEEKKKTHSGSSVLVVSTAVRPRAASAPGVLCWGKLRPWIMNDCDWSIAICRSVFRLFLKAGAPLKAACVLQRTHTSKLYNALKVSICYTALCIICFGLTNKFYSCGSLCPCCITTSYTSLLSLLFFLVLFC